ncbi:DUF4335 domain-containing protein [Tychonema sp. BBK16]|uniref:DUF4335 domain-containing protein n=1 Tax=Tychonema sp. BBK16 TaxID=2699888 RepID=UPI001F4510FC|nr:DUF4335 domain-containing protein [Tychonema sp. BBK16]MCF6375100.1 DUF4335 domain-containing protein [Tychonema sp. BBK16]
MVLKRYTPPTCTLEVTAKSSPLSRWAGKPVLKSLSFELRLDDPRLPDTQHITLKGDRPQLESLHEAVNSYIQNFLGESSPWETSPTSEISHTISEKDSPPAARSAVMLDAAVNPYDLRNSGPKTADIPVPPHLEPRGLLAHNLFLGSLTVPESASVVPLSTVQLFDLATALDEYSSEVMALPSLGRSPKRSQPVPWLQVAAMVVASVGLTTGAIKMLQVRQSQVASAPTSAASSPSAQQNVAIGVSPSPSLTSPTPTPSATPSLPPLPPLPPPPISSSPSSSPSLPPIAISSTPATTDKPSPIQQPPLLFPANSTAPNSAPNSQGQVITIPAPAELPISAPSQLPPGLNVVPPVPPRLGPLAAPPLPPSLSAQFPIPQQPSALSRIPAIASSANTELPALKDTQPKAESDENQQASENQGNRTLFNTVPQVAEAKTYFEERWKPTEGMQETLEYSLQIDETGSIQNILPMGKAAGDYIDRTNMPLVGEPFVSAVSNGKPPRIRVVLRPNGRVQTFLEESE